MDIFLKITATVLIATVLCLVLGKQGKDYALLLSISACLLIFTTAGSFLQPILDFVEELIAIGNLQTQLLEILFKILGIGLISQITVMLCDDAGNKSISKTLRILTTVMMLWMTIPLLEEMLMLMKNILEAV